MWIAWLLGLLGALWLAGAFMRADPAALARAARTILPAALAAAGSALLAAGNVGAGGLALLLGLGIFLAGRLRTARHPPTEERTIVRAAALELEVDRRSGTLSGVVLAGRFEGQSLARLSFEQLLSLRTELRSDPESVGLVEAYLDRRFPVWREHA